MATLGLLLLVAPAQATFPGGNGRLALTVDVRPFPEASPIATIQTANPDGTDFVQLTNPITPEGEGQLAFSADWSPGGERLAFGTFIPRLNVSRVEVIDADGSNRAVVVEGGGRPQWMPDGRRIFLGSRLVDVEDGTSTRLGTFDNVPEELTIQQVDVSPDGTRVAFTAFSQVEECDFTEEPVECWLVDQPPVVYVVNLDGSGLTQVTGPVDDSSGPSWSPNGSRIAYSRLFNIHTIDVDGGNETNLGVSGRSPLWSPDGLQLLFEVPARFGGNGPRRDYYVMRADGSQPAKIIEGDSLTEYAVSSWQPIPNRAPDCTSVSATPDVLWPANRKLRLVELSGATDPDGGPVTLEITGVTQDEPIGASRDAQEAGDDSQVRLRAERRPGHDGRVYRIAFEASDGAGGSCAGTATVSVPRHKRAAADDSAPPSYDSFGP